MRKTEFLKATSALPGDRVSVVIRPFNDLPARHKEARVYKFAGVHGSILDLDTPAGDRLSVHHVRVLEIANAEARRALS